MGEGAERAAMPLAPILHLFVQQDHLPDHRIRALLRFVDGLTDLAVAFHAIGFQNLTENLAAVFL
jgi:hypothetical protein